MTDFGHCFAAFFDEYVQLQPVAATAIGDHRHDGVWPDGSAKGRAARVAFAQRWLAEFGALDADALSAQDAIDRDLVTMDLEASRFADVELREESWNPLEWVYLLGDGLFPLIVRAFAPLAERLASVAARLEGMPELLDGAREALVGLPGKPVGRFQTETALAQLPGITELIGDAQAESERAAPDDPAVAAIGPRLEKAADVATKALAAFETHLRDVVLPASEGDARLGADLFGRKMRHTMRSEALTPERILAAADREFTAVRAEMVRLARTMWQTWHPDQPVPDEDAALVRGVLDAIAAVHPAAADLLDYCRAENARIETFCREHDLIGLVDDPLRSLRPSSPGSRRPPSPRRTGRSRRWPSAARLTGSRRRPGDSVRAPPRGWSAAEASCRCPRAGTTRAAPASTRWASGRSRRTSARPCPAALAR